MIGSAQGGMSIEDVARDNPEAILTQPVDILEGIKEEQAISLSERLGFRGPLLKKVRQVIHDNQSINQCSTYMAPFRGRHHAQSAPH